MPSGNSEQPGVAGTEYVCLRVYVQSILILHGSYVLSNLHKHCISEY